MQPRDRGLEVRVEEGLGSRGKLRILRELARRPDELFTKYAVEKRTGLRPVDVRADLRSLVGSGWVEERRNRLVKYRIKLDDELVRRTVEYFRSIGYLG